MRALLHLRRTNHGTVEMRSDGTAALLISHGRGADNCSADSDVVSRCHQAARSLHPADKWAALTSGSAEVGALWRWPKLAAEIETQDTRE